MIVDGMEWAVLFEEADVVSMSLGYDLPGNTARMIAKGVDTVWPTTWRCVRKGS